MSVPVHLVSIMVYVLMVLLNMNVSASRDGVEQSVKPVSHLRNISIVHNSHKIISFEEQVLFTIAKVNKVMVIFVVITFGMQCFQMTMNVSAIHVLRAAVMTR